MLSGLRVFDCVCVCVCVCVIIAVGRMLTGIREEMTQDKTRNVTYKKKIKTVHSFWLNFRRSSLKLLYLCKPLPSTTSTG